MRIARGAEGSILTGWRSPFCLHPYQPNHMNPPYTKTANGHDVEPKRPPSGDSLERGPRPETRRPLNVDDLVIRQIEAWQMDTEVQAFIHKAERKGSPQVN